MKLMFSTPAFRSAQSSPSSASRLVNLSGPAISGKEQNEQEKAQLRAVLIGAVFPSAAELNDLQSTAAPSKSLSSGNLGVRANLPAPAGRIKLGTFEKSGL